MRATLMYGAGDVRVENVPDAQLKESTDALVVVTRAGICGSDLWPYKGMKPSDVGSRMGHEFIGVVEAIGKDVRTIKVGDFVAAPFAWSDGTCEFCQQGLQTSCLHGGWWGGTELDGGQGEAVRVPQADGTLVPIPVGKDHELMPSLLTLTDVMATGHHAAVAAKVSAGKIAAVVGGGAVGLCGVIAAKRLGAEQIIFLDRHADRINLAKEFGATDIVTERGDEAIARVREITKGLGAHSVLECVGYEESTRTALSIARAGGAVGRVGVPQGEEMPIARPTFYGNVTIAGGPAPARAYMNELLVDVLDGSIQPGKVFDFVGALDQVPDGYRAMNNREAIKAIIEF
ncbi:MAG TPA: alcohol dehydrogenase catalytic domain-containing protein [Anaerolineales bacterium]|nr:alcohol dehydrogenase catalytic domain-containing protein [Anaerolineales bacterium]HNQ93982.1 alcohol dehydrogenase catalytic domain-containing protein [Anaerolineales bacterium]HNS60979.1 alcohol dehydrogenase catalytic domain-containing protein [Anaerolineales bacterium]